MPKDAATLLKKNTPYKRQRKRKCSADGQIIEELNNREEIFMSNNANVSIFKLMITALCFSEYGSVRLCICKTVHQFPPILLEMSRCAAKDWTLQHGKTASYPSVRKVRRRARSSKDIGGALNRCRLVSETHAQVAERQDIIAWVVRARVAYKMYCNICSYI